MKKIFVILVLLPFKILAQFDAGLGIEISCKTALSNAVLNQENARIELNQSYSKSASNSTFEVTYTGFSDAEKLAFQAATDIWAKTLYSKIPIKINATFESLGSTTLATTNATKIYKNFSSLALKDVWYPVALAEAISGTNINSAEDEINIKLNRNINWSTNLVGQKINQQFDMITVVLHEITHGLGFSSSFQLAPSNNTQAQYGQTGFPYIYDNFVQTASSVLLTNTSVYTNPSAELKTAVTNSNCWFGVAANSLISGKPKLYAPTTLTLGESISHLDEQLYGTGTPNSLMSPLLAMGEVIHEPGNVVLAILNQIGWAVNYNSSTMVLASEPANIEKSKIYPNPVLDFLNIKLSNAFVDQSVRFRIYNTSGHLVEERTGVNISGLNVENLFAAEYIIKIQSAENQETIRFVKF